MNEPGSARAVLELRKKGYKKAFAIRGGLNPMIGCGFPYYDDSRGGVVYKDIYGNVKKL